MAKSIDQEQAEEMALFCLTMNVSPKDYLDLTMIEINAFWAMHQKINKKNR